MRPPSHGAGERFRAMVDDCGGDLTLVDNDLFLTTPDEWRAWVDGGEDGDRYRQETRYRHVRRETGTLTTDEGDPVDGEWNYDDQNCETPPDDWEPRAPRSTSSWTCVSPIRAVPGRGGRRRVGARPLCSRRR